MKFVMALKKANPTEDADGVLTPRGMDVAHAYALAWVKRSVRDLAIERQYPELSGLFYDIRVDAELARRHAA